MSMTSKERAKHIKKDIMEVAVALDRAGVRFDLDETFLEHHLDLHADGPYEERARVLALACKLAVALGYAAWLAEHPAEDTTWDPRWRTIVFLELPAGQVSWHLRDDQVRFFGFLKGRAGDPWDGHSTEEKYRRLEEITGG